MTGPNSGIGIVAGGGIFPLEIARSVAARGGPLHVIMIEGDADDGLRAFPHTVVHWSKLGRAVKALRRAGISDVILVGTMARPDLKAARPDLSFVMAFPAILRALTAGGDDALLRGILGIFQTHGFTIAGVTSVAPELLVGDGALTLTSPSERDEADIATGFALIAALGRHDIGQAAVVSGGVIEAIEGAEGTDRMIARVCDRRSDHSGDPAGRRQGVLVKRPKPGQDLRVDLPAIGLETVERVAAAGLAGIAAMSGHVLIGNRLAMIQGAERCGLFVTGIAGDAGPEPLGHRARAPVKTVILGSVPPQRSLTTDMIRGARVMSVLASFATGSALAVREKRVLAIGASEPPGDVLARVTRKGRRRSGVAVIGPREALDEPLVSLTAECGLEGLVVMYGKDDRPQHQGPVIELADRLGLFIAASPIDEPEADE